MGGRGYFSGTEVTRGGVAMVPSELQCTISIVIMSVSETNISKVEYLVIPATR